MSAFRNSFGLHSIPCGPYPLRKPYRDIADTLRAAFARFRAMFVKNRAGLE